MADLSQEIGEPSANRGGWGNIFTYNSPEVDKLGDRLWQTERLNAINGNKQRMAAQKQMDSEEKGFLGKIRGADAPDFVNAYSDYKNAAMNFNKNQANLSLEDRIAAQMDRDAKFAKALQIANGSQQWKQYELTTGKDIVNPANQNKYADNAGDLLATSMQTPLSKLKNVQYKDANGNTTTIDLTDPKSFLYQSNTNFTPDLNTAKGTLRKLNEVDTSKPTDLVHTLNQYSGYNNYNNYYNNLVSSVASDDVKNKVSAQKRVKDFLTQFGNISDNDYAATEAKFNQVVNDPNYAKVYGTPQPFPKSADDTQVGKVAKYLAMQHVLNNPPTTQLAYKDNRGNIIPEQQAFALKKQQIGINARLANAKQLYDYKEAQKEGKTEEYLNNNFNSLYNSNSGNLVTKKQDGTVENVTVLTAPDTFKKAFATQAINSDGKPITIQADDVVKLPNGNLKGYYYQRNPDGTIKTENGQQIQRIDITPVEVNPTVAKDVYGKVLSSAVKTSTTNSSTKKTSNVQELRNKYNY